MSFVISALLGFFKKNWKISLNILIILSIVAYFQIKISSIRDVAAEAIESSSNQLNFLKEQTRKQTEEKDKLLKEYDGKINEIEKKYQEQSILLEKEKKKKIKIITKYWDNPDKLINKIEERYGLRYVEKSNSHSN